jgi:PPM family protein phosphatase
MIRTEQAHLRIAALSHPGMTGKNNEDRYAVTSFRAGEHNPTPSVLAVLCDGIGGHRAGEVAAEMAVNAITSTIAGSGIEQPLATLHLAITSASDQVMAHAISDPNLRGMGATCACVWVIGSRLYTATVGDSRIYMARQGSIQQLSTDHTWIQEALERGVIKPDEIKGHPNAHVIRRFLGSPNPPEIDFRLRLDHAETDAQAAANQGTNVQAGDIILLCSDGLTDLVPQNKILAALQMQSPDLTAQSLVDQANAAGGHDNITVIVLSIPPEAVQPTGQEKKNASPRRWRWLLGCSLLALLVVVIGAVVIGLGLLSGASLRTPVPTPTITLSSALQTVFPAGNPTQLPLAPPVSTPWP